MTAQYRTFFGLSREPFRSDLNLKEILKTPALSAVQDRFDYTVRLGGIALVTGEIGSGKSTALRYVAATLHPSEYRTIPITATPGSILELYRLILAELRIEKTSSSRAILTRLIQKEIRDLYEGKKIKPVLIIDEASLLRLEVFAELHTLTQFDQDSKPYLPIILAGQSLLVDQLVFRTSPAPGFPDHRPLPSPGRLPAGNGGLAAPPSDPLWPEKQPPGGGGDHRHPAGFRRPLPQSQSPGPRRLDRCRCPTVPPRHRRARPSGGH